MRETSVYSIVQYLPDPDRQEGVNVGIVIVDFSSGKFETRFASSFPKVRLNEEPVSPGFIKMALSELDRRIYWELRSKDSVMALKSFINMRSNNIRLTPFLPTFSQNLVLEAERLFAELVGDVVHKPRGTRVATKMRASLSKLGILQNFDTHPEKVSLPRYKVVIQPDLAIRKSVYHLIEASNFRTPDEGLQSAGKHALEGRALYNNLGMKLIVVGDFSDHSNDYYEAIRSDLADAETKLYRIDRLDELARDVIYH